MNDTTRDEPMAELKRLAELAVPMPWESSEADVPHSAKWDFKKACTPALILELFRLAACSSLPDGPVAYTVACEAEGRTVYLGGFYLAASVDGVKTQVLDHARREGFTGTADERLAELGWRIAALAAPSAQPPRFEDHPTTKAAEGLIEYASWKAASPSAQPPKVQP